MGYSTDFTGELRFTRELKASEIALLTAMLGEDCRDHPEWKAPDLYYIDLQLTKDFGGLEWDGSEKTYDLDKLVNVVIRIMRESVPDFGLTGWLNAQGESQGDVWRLLIGEDGWASKQKLALAPSGKKVTCPECDHEFEP